MTPAKLQALCDVAADVHSDKPSKPKVSTDPAADLAALGATF